MAAPSIITTFFCPLIGYLSDKFKKRGVFLLIASAISALTQLWIYLQPKTYKSYLILLPLTFNQFGFTLFVANIWPGLSILLKNNHPDELIQPVEDGHDHEINSSRQSLAIGIVSSFTNIGMAVSPLIIGFLLDQSQAPPVSKVG